MGFSNVLISDGLKMEALNGTMGERALKSLEAGLDLVIYGKGEIDAMRDIVVTLQANNRDHLTRDSVIRLLASNPDFIS